MCAFLFPGDFLQPLAFFAKFTLTIAGGAVPGPFAVTTLIAHFLAMFQHTLDRDQQVGMTKNIIADLYHGGGIHWI